MPYQKFDLRKLDRLNDPGRFDTIRPDVMWKQLDAEGARVIVEIGAGTGLFSAKFASMAPDAVVYSVDIEQTMIDWMREHRPEVAEGRVIPVLGEESHVPLDDRIADAVIMINLHHELVDPRAVYREAYRLLGHSGRLLVVDWAPRETPHGPPLKVRVRPAVLGEMLGSAGFESVRVQEDALAWHTLATATKS